MSAIVLRRDGFLWAATLRQGKREGGAANGNEEGKNKQPSSEQTKAVKTSEFCFVLFCVSVCELGGGVGFLKHCNAAKHAGSSCWQCIGDNAAELAAFGCTTAATHAFCSPTIPCEEGLFEV